MSPEPILKVFVKWISRIIGGVVFNNYARDPLGSACSTGWADINLLRNSFSLEIDSEWVSIGVCLCEKREREERG